MTQIGQMYEKEKIEYGNQRAKEAVRKMAKAMLDEDIDIGRRRTSAPPGYRRDSVSNSPKCCGSCSSDKAIRLR